tara:strand:+ start:1705 stop:2448 length:744 start_codon:yes stop_codon:yes gene_type:complete
MKYLLIISMSLSTFLFSEEYEFEPVPNKAEYYSGNFNKGKDIEDLYEWAEKFVRWTEEREGIWESMETVIFTPYYSNDLQQTDFVWLNLHPNSTSQYRTVENWAKEGGKIFSTIPITNSSVTEVWQWPISTPDGEISEKGFVRFTDCKLSEGVTMREAFDAYKRFAIKAKSTGDTMGRKMLMSPVGAGNIDFDFVYSLYANSPSEYGKNVDNFGSNLRETPEAEALNDIAQCGNGRSYTTVRVKEAN